MVHSVKARTKIWLHIVMFCCLLTETSAINQLSWPLSDHRKQWKILRVFEALTEILLNVICITYTIQQLPSRECDLNLLFMFT